MRVPFETLRSVFRDKLLKYGFPEKKADLCAAIFAGNSRDGVASHGLNRFPVFISYVKEGWVDPKAEPEPCGGMGALEQWDGHLGPGMYNASLAMDRAITLAKQHGVGAVALKNTNHWMRGGTYGWQAAEAGCACICMTNTIANMPAWGGKEPRIGNNPLVMAVPYAAQPLVLDMAMSQYSYGKLQEYEFRGESLPVHGGYDEQGVLTQDPAAIRSSQRVLPVGFWKGSGLSVLIDLFVSVLSNGNPTARISRSGKEYGLSQFFLCVYPGTTNHHTIQEIIAFTKMAADNSINDAIRIPGESVLRQRRQNEKEGVPVNENIWKEVQSL
jgi:3-dehydro-L-gulonate 2-dehydrogenase